MLCIVCVVCACVCVVCVVCVCVCVCKDGLREKGINRSALFFPLDFSFVSLVTIATVRDTDDGHSTLVALAPSARRRLWLPSPCALCSFCSFLLSRWHSSVQPRFSTTTRMIETHTHAHTHTHPHTHTHTLTHTHTCTRFRATRAFSRLLISPFLCPFLPPLPPSLAHRWRP